MLYKRDTIVQLVHFKARELGINPKLLILAITALARDQSAVEKSVFKLFFQELLKETRESIEKQVQSNYKKTRDEAQEALMPLNEKSEAFANSSIYGSCRLNELWEDGPPILNLHYKVWNLVVDQQIKIKRLYAKTYIAEDAVQIIKYLCPKEIQQFRAIGPVQVQ
ncbi:MAG: hypothetical protein NVS9B7_20340 [Flavisolibacter sp.]